MSPRRGEKPLFIILSLFYVAVAASAQTPEPLRLSRQQAIDEALARNPALAAARAQVEEARAAVVTAGALPDATFVAMRHRDDLQQSKQLASDFVDKTQARFQGGTDPRVDVVKAETDLA